MVDHQRQRLLALGEGEGLNQRVALTGCLGHTTSGVALLRQLDDAGISAGGEQGRTVDHRHHDGVAAEELAIGKGRDRQTYIGVVFARILLLFVEAGHQIVEGRVILEAVVLHLHQAKQIGIHCGNGIDDLGALLLELGLALGTPVATFGVVGIRLIFAQDIECAADAGVTGEVVEHVEAADPQIAASEASRRVLTILFRAAQQGAGSQGDIARYHQTERILVVYDHPLQSI